MKRQLLEWIYFAIIMLVLMFVTIQSQAAKLTSKQRQVITSVAQQHGLNPNKLIRIAFVESTFRETAIRHNTNGTTDYGLFQINSIHINTTCKGLNIYTLVGNTSCAAKLLVIHKKASDTDIMWYARFHSKTPSKKAMYFDKLNSIPEHIVAGL